MALFGKGRSFWRRRSKTVRRSADPEMQARSERRAFPGKAGCAQDRFDEAEREYRQFVVPTAERIFGRPLPRSVASELEKVYAHFVMRGISVSGERTRHSTGDTIANLLAQAHPDAASFASLFSALDRGKILFADSAALTDEFCGVFWKKCIETAAKTLAETGCLDGDEVECIEAEAILHSLCRIEACFRPDADPDDAAALCRAFALHLQTFVSAHCPVPRGTQSAMADTAEYTYCTVSVPGIEKSYSYLAGDAEYAPGDMVTVPFGRENELRTGKVIAVQRCTAADAPYPPSRTKTILGKAD